MSRFTHEAAGPWRPLSEAYPQVNRLANSSKLNFFGHQQARSTPHNHHQTPGRVQELDESDEPTGEYPQTGDKSLDSWHKLYNIVQAFAASSGRSCPTLEEWTQLLYSLFPHFLDSQPQYTEQPSKSLVEAFWSRPNSKNKAGDSVETPAGVLIHKQTSSLVSTATTSNSPGTELVTSNWSEYSPSHPHMSDNNSRHSPQGGYPQQPTEEGLLERLHRIQTQSPGYQAGATFAGLAVDGNGSAVQGNVGPNDIRSNVYGYTRVSGGGCLIQGNVTQRTADAMAPRSVSSRDPRGEGNRLGSSQDLVGGQAPPQYSSVQTSAAQAARQKWAAH